MPLTLPDSSACPSRPTARLHWGKLNLELDVFPMHGLGATWCFDILIRCELISTVKPSNISIPSYSYHLFFFSCACVVRMLKRSTLLANFVYFSFKDFQLWKLPGHKHPPSLRKLDLSGFRSLPELSPSFLLHVNILYVFSECQGFFGFLFCFVLQRAQPLL